MTDMLFPMPTSYSPDFELAWAAWRPTKNDGKAPGFVAFQKTRKRRLFLGAFGQRLTFCIEGYLDWLALENETRRKHRQADHAKAHLSTWLNQARYESYIDDANARILSLETLKIKGNMHFMGWESQAQLLVAEIGAATTEAWFSDAMIIPGDPTKISFPTKFKAQYALNKFRFPLRRAFNSEIEIGVTHA